MGFYGILIIAFVVASLSILTLWLEHRQTKAKKRKKKKKKTRIDRVG